MWCFSCFKKQEKNTKNTKNTNHNKTVHFENDIVNPLTENDHLSRRTTVDNTYNCMIDSD